MYPLVEFDRSPLNRERLFAFVLKWSDSLTLVQIVDDERFDLNGYAVFHNSTVRRWRDVNDESILARALRANRVKPAMVRGLNLEDWPGLLKTATARSSPIAVFREKLKRYNFHAGRVVKVGRKKFDLLEIEPDDLGRRPPTLQTQRRHAGQIRHPLSGHAVPLLRRGTPRDREVPARPLLTPDCRLL